VDAASQRGDAIIDQIAKALKTALTQGLRLNGGMAQ
jgi:hypothetical protein